MSGRGVAPRWQARLTARLSCWPRRRLRVPPHASPPATQSCRRRRWPGTCVATMHECDGHCPASVPVVHRFSSQCAITGCDLNLGTVCSKGMSPANEEGVARLADVLKGKGYGQAAAGQLGVGVRRQPHLLACRDVRDRGVDWPPLLCKSRVQGIGSCADISTYMLNWLGI